MGYTTFQTNEQVIRKAIQDVCELLGVKTTDIHISTMKAVIDFEDGTTYWFMFSYSRIQREDVVTAMVDYFLSVKRTDESEGTD